jgi:hypothetical protein
VIIGIDSSLNYIKQYLESTGKYEIYTLGEYLGPLDVFIYEDKQDYSLFDQYQNEAMSNLLQHTPEVNPGILMIHAKGKSPKEIERMIDTRLYNRL